MRHRDEDLSPVNDGPKDVTEIYKPSPVERSEVITADAVREAEVEVGKHKNPQIRSYKIRGRTGEILAYKARPNSIDANDYIHNHPVYDLYDRNHAYSVKTRFNKPDGSVPIGNYAHDLRVAIGAVSPAKGGRYAGMQGVDIAADRLATQKVEQTEAWQKFAKHIPVELAHATRAAEMTAVMKDKAQLLIPADHVNPVRDYIKRVAQAHPEKYGLSSNLSPDQLDLTTTELAARVKPITKGVTSQMIGTYIKKTTQPQQRYH